MKQDTGPVIRMRGITKRFGDLAANDGVDFELRPGEIHALLGENGAGKSTLMNVLSGLYRAESGTIELDGRPVSLSGPRAALSLGIGMVHQHFMLVKKHTVAENVMLGLRGGGLSLRPARIHREIEELSARFHLPVDPSARIWQLSIGERQRVEILKLLYRKTRILILDEPTSVLTPGEVEHLFATLRQIRASGRSVVFISHKLEEVLSVSDRITVLRRGRNVATVSPSESSAASLAAMMVGELTVPVASGPTERPTESGTVLELREISAMSRRGLPALREVSLRVGRGEIFGVVGVAGNGQRELAEVVTGLIRPTGGSVLLEGRDMTGAGPREMIDSGVAHIPEDRLGMGIVDSLSVAENLLLKRYRRPPHSRGFVTSPRAMEREARFLIERYGISPPDPRQQAAGLSGGNVQRLILARELSGSPALLVAAYPFQGLDVAATDFLCRTLKERAALGLAVLLIGEDLDLTIGLCDTIGVMFAGRLAGVFPAGGVRMEELGLLMAGKRPEREAW